MALLSARGPGSPPPRPRAGFRDATKPVTLAVGQEFELVLSSNATTGYHWWVVEPIDPAVGTFLAREYVSDSNPDRKAGVGGTEYWAFKAQKAGQSKVTLRYSRAELGGEEAERRTFTIVVH